MKNFIALVAFFCAFGSHAQSSVTLTNNSSCNMYVTLYFMDSACNGSFNTYVLMAGATTFVSSAISGEYFVARLTDTPNPLTSCYNYFVHSPCGHCGSPTSPTSVSGGLSCCPTGFTASWTGTCGGAQAITIN